MVPWGFPCGGPPTGLPQGWSPEVGPENRVLQGGFASDSSNVSPVDVPNWGLHWRSSVAPPKWSPKGFRIGSRQGGHPRGSPWAVPRDSGSGFPQGDLPLGSSKWDPHVGSRMWGLSMGVDPVNSRGFPEWGSRKRGSPVVVPNGFRPSVSPKVSRVGLQGGRPREFCQGVTRAPKVFPPAWSPRWFP